MTKPLLLLDVDGVLNAMGPGDGGEMHTIQVDGFPFRYSIDTGDRLRKLAETFQLIWATAWEDDANKFLCPLWQMDDLPVIKFAVRYDAGMTWKLRNVQEFVKNQPCAWIDDDFHSDAYIWAEIRGEEEEIPTKLVHTNPAFGLTTDMVFNLLLWGSQLRHTQSLEN